LIDKVKKKLLELMEDGQSKGDKKIVIIDPESLLPPSDEREPDMRTIGLFGDVAEEKVAELIQALLYLNELNKLQPEEEERKPIEFYVSTYGGNADDMFALFDIMTIVKKETDIQTIGLGKVMSAGVLILAAGTEGQRRIGKNCRVMIHNVIGGSMGSLPNLANELGAIEQLQEDYIRALVESTKMTRKQLRKMLNEKVNVYLDAEEAVKLGIADIIV
jgi:ATP-dependent Clp endopeptidase proteolytic subunit ClpP|tara:strand:+ start:4340 stop:4993 length:654 start_codon:yes stop_codon:yes gene_type:complete